MATKYTKAPAFVGKTLTLMVGRADMKILDGMHYDDPALAKFVGQGFLVVVPGSQAVAPAPAAAPAAAPADPPKDESKAEDSTSKKRGSTKRKSSSKK